MVAPLFGSPWSTAVAPLRPRLPLRGATTAGAAASSRVPETPPGNASPANADVRSLSSSPTAPTASTTDITVLYVDFPDVVQRWDVEELLTAGLVADTHAHINAVISIHGGRMFPALLDARYARFGSASSAVAAAIAIARGDGGPGPLAVSLGLASGPAPADEYGHLRIVNQARAIAELAGPCGVVLAQSTVELIAGAVPDEARLSPMGVRRLPELNSLDQPSRLFLFGQAECGTPRRRVVRFVDRLRRFR